MILTNPYISIDNTFEVRKHCSWIPGGYTIGDIVAQDFVGGLHVNAVFRKELFQLQFMNLDEDISDTLEKISIELGVNVFHTIVVISPKMKRIWDGVTASSFGINYDIGRVRNQVYFSKFDKKRIPGNPNRYQITLECKET